MDYRRLYTNTQMLTYVRLQCSRYSFGDDWKGLCSKELLRKYTSTPPNSFRRMFATRRWESIRLALESAAFAFSVYGRTAGKSFSWKTYVSSKSLRFRGRATCTGSMAFHLRAFAWIVSRCLNVAFEVSLYILWQAECLKTVDDYLKSMSML